MLGLLSAPAAGAEELHLWSEQAQFEHQQFQLMGSVRAFWQDFQLLAEQIQGSASTGFIKARGKVVLRAPSWQLTAESLDIDLQRQQISAQVAEIRYGRFIFRAAELQLNPLVWTGTTVTVSLDGKSWPLSAQSLVFLPASAEQLLQLSSPQLKGAGLGLPFLELRLNPEAQLTELRTPAQRFQPQLSWTQGQLQAGLSSLIWQDPEQRLFAQSLLNSGSGWQNDLFHEWRPTTELLLNSQLGLLNLAPHARFEGLVKTPWPLWLKTRLDLQQPQSFAHEFWLPEQNLPLAQGSGLELWLASEPLTLGALESRWLVAGRFPDNQWGLSWLGNLPLWQDGFQQISGSWLLNGLYDRQATATAGLRLLDQLWWSPQLQSGVYLEQYFSSLGPERFLQSGRLAPWGGAFLHWQFSDDLGLTLESALRLDSLEPVLADALLSWRVFPLYLHLLLRGFPASLQVNLQIDWSP